MGPPTGNAGRDVRERRIAAEKACVAEYVEMKQLTARQALQHPWILGGAPSAGPPGVEKAEAAEALSAAKLLRKAQARLQVFAGGVGQPARVFQPGEKIFTQVCSSSAAAASSQ